MMPSHTHKNIMTTYTTQTLSGILLDRDGYEMATGVCARITDEGHLLINSTLHLLEDVRIFTDRIEAIGGAWTLLL